MDAKAKQAIYLAEEKRRVTVEEAMARLPSPDGKPFVTVLEYGSLSVEIYAPRGEDLQQPHARDEAYVVVQGSGEFINGKSRQPFGAGDFLFVPAGVEHRFVKFTDDLIVWVIFYGVEGGEANAAWSYPNAPPNKSLDVRAKQLA